MTTIETIFEDGDWLTAEEINRLQKSPLETKSLLVHDWQQCGRVFGVSYEGKEYFARYQFDSLYQPLPVIKDILDAYGAYEDPWSVAAWFHFPNGWIAEQKSEGATPVSPKDALNRCDEVVNAAGNRKGSYVA